jgi:hypothetical protein
LPAVVCASGCGGVALAFGPLALGSAARWSAGGIGSAAMAGAYRHDSRTPVDEWRRSGSFVDSTRV